MATDLELAYMAGVIDSDGYIGVQRSTYAMRVRKDAGQPVYAERIVVRQVEPQAVGLLHQSFGGHRGINDPSAKRGRPLHHWGIHSAAAGRALAQLLPFLRIKRRQAENALALRAMIGEGRGWPVPAIIEGEPMMTAAQFAAALGANLQSISQACRQGSVPSVQISKRRRLMPVSFLETYRARMEAGGRARRSQEVSEAMEVLFQKAKALNKVGV